MQAEAALEYGRQAVAVTRSRFMHGAF